MNALSALLYIEPIREALNSLLATADKDKQIRSSAIRGVSPDTVCNIQ